MSKKTNEHFVETVTQRHPTFIVNKIPEHWHDLGEVTCTKCGQTFEMTRKNMMENHQCPVCMDRKIIAGYNDVVTRFSWIKEYVDEETLNGLAGMKSYCDKKIISTCPKCGYKRETNVKCLISSVSKCPLCSDGITYPNKFGRALIKQLPIKLTISEYSPPWIGKMKYDNYFVYNDQEYILEMDGGFHYAKKQFKGSLEDKQRVDELKDKLAIEHGMIIIRIDCQKSNAQYIRQNILKSKLAEIFDLSNVDWDLCETEKMDSLMIRVCDDFNNGKFRVIKDIADRYNISNASVSLYLKKGKQIGYCKQTKIKYDGRFELNDVPVEVFDENKQLIGIYQTLSEAINKLNLLYPNIKFVRHSVSTRLNMAQELRTNYKGFYFRRYRKEGLLRA